MTDYIARLENMTDVELEAEAARLRQVVAEHDKAYTEVRERYAAGGEYAPLSEEQLIASQRDRLKLSIVEHRTNRRNTKVRRAEVEEEDDEVDADEAAEVAAEIEADEVAANETTEKDPNDPSSTE